MKDLIKLLSVLHFSILFLSGCQNETPVKVSPVVRISVKSEATPVSGTDTRQLSFTVCLFQALAVPGKEMGDADFICIETAAGLSKEEVGNYSFKVSQAEKGTYTYRLFVHATLAGEGRQETVVGLSRGERFDQLEISLVMENGVYVNLSEDNYYDYQTLNEEDLSGTSVIRLELKRLVGRLVFDVFKSDTNLNPVDIDPGFGSVLDRVKRIEMRVKGMTTSFKPSGSAVVKSESASACLQLDTRLDQDWRLYLAAQDPDYFSEVEKKNSQNQEIRPAGGVRLFSVCLLPTGNDGKEMLTAELTFFYEDEYAENTPSGTKKLILKLPSGNSDCLKVAENCYTLSSIRLKNNRIIDLNTSTGIEIETDWDKQY